jgi:16S rRNA (adenine1518-N6/adenine1519-N6)-dimethyltransferase
MKYHPATEQLLTTLGVSPLKRYGQNFLIDDKVIAAILDAAKIKPKDKILEIGPGLGAITQGLKLATIQYTSYEIDVAFHRYLQTTFPQGTHHRQNFLKAEPQAIDVILGNLPYYMTTEILEKIYKDFSSFKRAILMVQKEVIPRLTAQPGDEAYGPLAIFLSTLGKIISILEVSPVSFYPEPHVQSILFQIEALKDGPLVDPKPFFYFIKKLFLHRRKTILNNLMGFTASREAAEALLKKAKITPNARPETISVHEYLTLFKLVSSKKII